MNDSGGAPELLVLILGSFLLVAGLILVLAGLRHQSPANPLRPTLNPTKWKPVWLQDHHFTSRSGFSVYVLGFHLISLGAALDLAYLLLR
jgi:hypothetical protein